jgi:hypothetical protein
MKPTTFIKINETECEVIARILTPGTYTSGRNGKTYTVTETDLTNIKDVYNSSLKKFWARLRREEEFDAEAIEMAPVQVEHELHAEVTKGRIIGKMWVEEYNGSIALYSRMRIKGDENVKRIEDGSYQAVSISYNVKTHLVYEVSLVTYGADDDALILSARTGDDNISFIKAKDDIASFGLMIKEKEQEIASLRSDAADLIEVASFSRKLQNLVKNGKITLATKKTVLRDLDSVKDQVAKQAVIAMFGRLPQVVHSKQKYSQDTTIEEMLMSDKNTQRAEMIASFRKNIMGNAADNAQFSIDAKIGKEQSHVKSEHEIILNKTDAQEFKRLLAARDFEGLEALSKTAFGAETDETNKTDLSAKDEDADKKEKEAKDKESQAKKAEQDKAEYMKKVDDAMIVVAEFLKQKGE